ncbi:MAG: hypothetical protein QME07_07585 [bacterium]|nr:hypothetical protein [bacterium]
MGLEELWQKALYETEILRARLSLLGNLDIPLDYIFLAESSVNIGDTVVRKGSVQVHKPLIFLPREFSMFSGFEFEKEFGRDSNEISNFLLTRGVRFPSGKYDHLDSTISVYEKPLSKAISEFRDSLEKEEDIKTGLLKGSEDCWQFSVLMYAASQVAKSAPADIRRFLDDFKKRGWN